MPTTLSRIQDEKIIGTIASLVALALMAVANFDVSEGENGGPAEYAVTGVVLLAVAALVFGRLVSSTAQPARLAGWLALAAAVTTIAFWAGLPIVLGAGAIVAGSRAQSTGGTLAAIAGTVIAAATAVMLVVG